ncbi:hypothetical protein EBU94_04475 [bacterium]|nr:hypothetical protein [bacterium]
MPEFFAFFTKAVIESGGEIHIITGGLTTDEWDLMEKYDIKYSKLFSIRDYHKEKGTPTYKNHPVHGFPMITDEEWDKTKGEYCEREGIDLHIDDTIQYEKNFKTPFCMFFKK